MFDIYVVCQSNQVLDAVSQSKNSKFPVISEIDVLAIISLAKEQIEDFPIVLPNLNRKQRKIALRAERKAWTKLIDQIKIYLNVLDNTWYAKFGGIKLSCLFKQDVYLLKLVSDPNSSLHNVLKRELTNLFEVETNLIFVGTYTRKFRHGTHYVKFNGSESFTNLLSKKLLQYTRYTALSQSLSSVIAPITTHRFDHKEWPNHPLMSHCKKQVQIFIKQYLSSEVILDDKDLLYQILFRLTTIPISDVFQNGIVLDEYLENLGTYKSWKNILQISKEFVKQFSIRPDVLMEVIKEQESIILNRIATSSLSEEFISKMLNQGGIFEEGGWLLCRKQGDIFTIKGKRKIPVYLREIDPEVAKEVHRVLHYIHTPRSQFAFGLFLNDSEIPFSIVAFDKIEREYKKNALLLNGYDPEESIDLTRLYSSSGTPMNTSSLFFSSAFRLIKKNRPHIKSIMSAFMPNYATGMSMVSAGFYHPMLIKPNVHTFGGNDIGGRMVYEHLTPRRAFESSDTITSLWPLLPVIELFAPLTKSFGVHPSIMDKTICHKC